jgi:MraZ protein
VFLGTYEPKLDEKGRIILPAKFRDELSSGLVLTPDKQHRLTIPTTLRTYAGLDRDLAVIGAGSRVEIWDAAAWQTYLTEQEAAFAETAEEVIPGLF